MESTDNSGGTRHNQTTEIMPTLADDAPPPVAALGSNIDVENQLPVKETSCSFCTGDGWTVSMVMAFVAAVIVLTMVALQYGKEKTVSGATPNTAPSKTSNKSPNGVGTKKTHNKHVRVKYVREEKLTEKESKTRDVAKPVGQSSFPSSVNESEEQRVKNITAIPTNSDDDAETNSDDSRGSNSEDNREADNENDREAGSEQDCEMDSEDNRNQNTKRKYTSKQARRTVRRSMPTIRECVLQACRAPGRKGISIHAIAAYVNNVRGKPTPNQEKYRTTLIRKTREACVAANELSGVPHKKNPSSRPQKRAYRFKTTKAGIAVLNDKEKVKAKRAAKKKTIAGRKKASATRKKKASKARKPRRAGRSK